MGKHLQRDLDHIKKELLAIGVMVEIALNNAIESLVKRYPKLAEEVKNGDSQIDQKENQIEEECLKVLALHHPVATDLRFIISVLKVNNDLERMGDLAANIAERSIYLATHEPLRTVLNFNRMVDGVREMVRKSLDALIRTDTNLARLVLTMDDEIDALNREMYTKLQNIMREDPESVDRAVHTLSVSRYLERIADLSTNIAEDVVFMVEGESIRHISKGEQKEPKQI
ncbi:MAG: phosphate signaling complex protein PhoU [Nitrospina sp.]|jgi:phosphate transport system protein|nr:phosphate signaling complex protein PhoU [Nitrospina sp.]MBT3508632.1 phosphate signaling complex protein PhoU [Nitrospina sp.]MBT3875656.1 phosphate signaling complex protein PhoU [Nitrospina sp.]MBT4048507.1 phosphate signaling complex protein PhoU [Nitrospina sp.]MBT4558917.1 phosphate signaling complex protein PhoU [Nitrospina sp.]